MREWIPASYEPRRHVLGMFGLGFLGVASLFVTHASVLRSVDLLAVPVLLLVGSALEYGSHRWLMHQRRGWFGLAWDAHTGRHHHYFGAETFSWDQARDIWLVLFSPFDVGLLIAILAVPAMAARAWIAPGAWSLGVCTAILYFLLYEALHLAYHLPDGHPALRFPGLAALRDRHRRHHLLVDMHVNYGVTSPLWDRILGTEAPRPTRGPISAPPDGVEPGGEGTFGALHQGPEPLARGEQGDVSCTPPGPV